MATSTFIRRTCLVPQPNLRPLVSIHISSRSLFTAIPKLQEPGPSQQISSLNSHQSTPFTPSSYQPITNVIPDRLWKAPLGTNEKPLTYHVNRTTPFGTLPVYTKMRPALSQVWTLIKKIDGDIEVRQSKSQKLQWKFAPFCTTHLDLSYFSFLFFSLSL